jgi:hypothetical protein
MRGRIRNLENMVVSLINQKGQQPDEGSEAGPTRTREDTAYWEDIQSPENGNAASFGKLHMGISGTKTSYVGAAHWSAILQEIKQVKVCLDDDEEDDEQDDEDDMELIDEAWKDFHSRSTVSIGMPHPNITKEILIQQMPPKEQVDRLLPLFFNSGDPIVYIVHAQTFQEEYRQYWRDPYSTPVMWIAMLYCAMALGIALGARNPGINSLSTTPDGLRDPTFNESSRKLGSINRFHRLASSAIAVGDIDKCQPFTLEAVTLFARVEFLRRGSHQSKIWLLHGVIFRVALRMGYHRDPSHFDGMTAFQGEMRRRVWHMLNMIDTLISFSIGLPSGIRHLESDVRLPLNIHDKDLSPQRPELPAPRPFTELTQSTYVICKIRMCRVFAEAAEFSHRVVPPKHSDIMALEKKLAEVDEMVPSVMRVRSMEESITDTPQVVMCRFTLELLHQKTRIVLHRNYIKAGQTDIRFESSRRICVDAAMKILRNLASIFHACQPGGQLIEVWWYMSQLTTYDFLLASMVLCLELDHIHSGESNQALSTIADPKVHEILSLLETTYKIWMKHPNGFDDATRGAKIVRAILKKYSDSPSPRIPSRNEALSGFETDVSTFDDDLAATATSMEDLPPQIWGPLSSTSAGPDMDMPTQLDWSMWDSTIQHQNNMLPQAHSLSSLSMNPWSHMSSPMGTATPTMFHYEDPINLDAPYYYDPSAHLPPRSN